MYIMIYQNIYQFVRNELLKSCPESQASKTEKIDFPESNVNLKVTISVDNKKNKCNQNHHFSPCQNFSF